MSADQASRTPRTASARSFPTRSSFAGRGQRQDDPAANHGADEVLPAGQVTHTALHNESVVVQHDGVKPAGLAPLVIYKHLSPRPILPNQSMRNLQPLARLPRIQLRRKRERGLQVGSNGLLVFKVNRSVESLLLPVRLHFIIGSHHETLLSRRRIKQVVRWPVGLPHTSCPKSKNNSCKPTRHCLQSVGIFYVTLLHLYVTSMPLNCNRQIIRANSCSTVQNIVDLRNNRCIYWPQTNKTRPTRCLRQQPVKIS